MAAQNPFHGKIWQPQLWQSRRQVCRRRNAPFHSGNGKRQKCQLGKTLKIRIDMCARRTKNSNPQNIWGAGVMLREVIRRDALLSKFTSIRQETKKCIPFRITETVLAACV